MFAGVMRGRVCWRSLETMFLRKEVPGSRCLGWPGTWQPRGEREKRKFKGER